MPPWPLLGGVGAQKGAVSTRRALGSRFAKRLARCPLLEERERERARERERGRERGRERERERERERDRQARSRRRRNMPTNQSVHSIH